MAYHTSIIAAADWRTDRRARCILASIAKHPPVARRLASHEQWDRVDSVFTGYRVEAIAAVREQIVGGQLKAAEALGSQELAEAVCRQISTQDAIRKAVDGTMRSSFTTPRISADGLTVAL